MDNELKRRQARQERKRRRKRQIRIRLTLIALGILVLVSLIIVTNHGKKAISALGTGLEDNTQQEESEIGDGGMTEASEEPDEPEQTAQPTGWTVIIDAGHGGKDQGCAYGETLEKDINLNVALLLENRLKAAGINVVMTREDDTFVYLNRRVEAAENVEADAYISIHVDSYSDDESINGLTIHYQNGAEGGKVLAQKLHEILTNADVTNVRKVMESDLYVLRNTSMPAALIEVGFLTNRTDRANLQSETFLEALTDSIYEGIIEYLNENAKN
jgi:N-acetylmuramoyl-L-alanine amidase